MQHTDSADTQHEYFADRPGFPAKTIVATLFIGAFFGYLNDTLLNVALTPIMRDFHIDKTTAQWLTTGFLLVMGAFTPITAGVIQWFETRKCALAPNFGVLLAGRMVQAISAAFVGTTNIGEHLSSGSSPQQAMLNGIHLNMSFALAVGILTIVCAYRLKPHGKSSD
ncbi:hypothetical protein A7P98_08870 [Eikenella sp. NML080894]|nr:hypothetical protein A7P98_08870 [Eikenella sp. NML080894]